MKVIDKLATREDMIAPGVSACSGCNVELTLRTMTKILGPNTILAVPPGCVGGGGGRSMRDSRATAQVEGFRHGLPIQRRRRQPIQDDPLSRFTQPRLRAQSFDGKLI